MVLIYSSLLYFWLHYFVRSSNVLKIGIHLIVFAYMYNRIIVIVMAKKAMSSAYIVGSVQSSIGKS